MLHGPKSICGPNSTSKPNLTPYQPPGSGGLQEKWGLSTCSLWLSSPPWISLGTVLGRDLFACVICSTPHLLSS